MRRRPSRLWTVVLALVAGAWAFFLLPPQQHAYSGAYAMPKWLFDLNELPIYDAVRDRLVSIGLSDFYVAFGAAASVSFLLIWCATGPALAALGWSGRVLSWLLLATAAITVVSYANTPKDAPLHALWGAEGVALLAIGLWALVVALVAPRTGTPLWERLLLAATLPIVIGATVAFTYWPHGSLIGLSFVAALLAVFAPRWADSARPAP